MRYAVCITTKGNAHVLETSLRSVLRHMRHEAGVHVVSADKEGSEAAAILRRLAQEPPGGLHVAFAPGCSRGEGRHLAFESAKKEKPDFVVQSVDTDNVYQPCVEGFFQYHEQYHARGDVFLQTYGLSIVPPAFMDELGAWKEGYQVMEDIIVAYRAAKRGRFVFVPTPQVTTHVRAPHRDAPLRKRARDAQYWLRRTAISRKEGYDAAHFEPRLSTYIPEDDAWRKMISGKPPQGGGSA